MKFWLSNRTFTVLVVVDNDGVITSTAPITRRFVGQEFMSLVRWSRSKFGDTEIVELFS